MPAAAATCSSSPPRPKMNGSPPLRRTTRLPCCASSTNSRLVSSSITECAPARLPTQMRSASRRTRSRISPLTRWSYSTTSACCITCSPRRVNSPTSPGPAPTKAISPCAPSSPAAKLCKSCSSCRSACAVWPLATSVAKRPPKVFSQKRRRSPIEASRCLTWPRQRPATCAICPKLAGSSASSFSRSNRASTGAWPLDDTATTSGERSMIDGKINEQRGWSSTTLANTRRLSASANTAAFSALSSVAAIARNTSSSCGGSKVFPSQSSCPR